MTLRVGLIGCGRWGRLILRDLIACGVDVHVVARGEAALGAALQGGARSARPDWSALADVDGFIVATPTSTHADVIEQLIPLHRPIFVEKPMTADLASARRVAAAAPDRLFVMDKWRYHPGIEAMRSRIAAGRLGQVLAIKLSRWGWGNPHADVSGLWILAPHDLSIVLHLIGAIPPVLAAWPAAASDPSLGSTALLGAAGAPTVTLDVGIASVSHVRRCLVIGALGTAELRDGYDDSIFIRDGVPGTPGSAEEKLSVGSAMPLLSEVQRFVAFLGGAPPPMSSAAEGLLVVERMAAIEAALARHGADHPP